MRLQELNRVRLIFDSMQTVLTESLLQAPIFGWGVGYFQPDPGNGKSFKGNYDAFTFNGGWHRRGKDGTPRLASDDNYGVDGKLRQDTIFLVVGPLQTRSDDYVVEVIIHELAHFVGPGGPLNGDRISDYSSMGEANFWKLNNWTALHTADTYGYFAAEAASPKRTIPIP